MTNDELKQARVKYNQHCRNCKQKKDRNGTSVEMRLTFEEWLKIWLDSGHWLERGRCGYVMGRIGDIGHYEVGNVVILPARDNISDANTGRVVGARQREGSRKAGESNIGKKRSDETKKRNSVAHVGLRWWTDGVVSIQSRTQPKDMAPGRVLAQGQGLRWWNNGVTAVKARECPPGYAPGRKLKW